jgi:sigma-E factor negative regulatory protein RseB
MAFPARAAPLAFTAIALLASSVAHAADPAAQDLLRRMSASLRSVDFEGSFIYQQDGRTDALRIFHLGGQQERERLVSLTGTRNEIVRDDRSVTCIQTGVAPTRFALRNESGLLPLLPSVRELGAEYTVAVAGSDRIAGYDASIVDIVPRDPYRYGYRLWLSRDNQLPLRSAIVDAKRQPLAQFMFVALDVGTKPSEADLAPAQTLAGAVTADGETRSTCRPRGASTCRPVSGSCARSIWPAMRSCRNSSFIPMASPASRSTSNRTRTRRRLIARPPSPNRLSYAVRSASTRGMQAASR